MWVTDSPLVLTVQAVLTGRIHPPSCRVQCMLSHWLGTAPPSIGRLPSAAWPAAQGPKKQLLQVIDPSIHITMPSEAEPEDQHQAGASHPQNPTDTRESAKTKPGRPRSEWPDDLNPVLANWLLQNPAIKAADAPQARALPTGVYCKHTTALAHVSVTICAVCM